MKILLPSLLLISLPLMACPDYYLLSDISAAYESPVSEKIERAIVQAVENFGHHKDLPFREKNNFSSTYFERNFFGIKMHSEAAGALSCLRDKLKECKFDGKIEELNDQVLQLHKMKLGFRITQENDCVKKSLTINGFYPLKDNNFVFIGKAEKVRSGDCPYNMVALKSIKFCIDKYEAPNIEGIRPFVARTAKEGIAYCALQGKELCPDTVWESACQNEDLKTPYPYGNTYISGKCNDIKIWRAPNWGAINRYDPNRPDDDPKAREHTLGLDQSEVSGARENCRTQAGAFDLTGNAAEWVYNTKKRPNTTNGEVYPVVMKGCYWSKCLNGINPSCKFTNSNHGPTFRSYEAGFRCCLKIN